MWIAVQDAAKRARHQETLPVRSAEYLNEKETECGNPADDRSYGELALMEKMQLVPPASASAMRSCEPPLKAHKSTGCLSLWTQPTRSVRRVTLIDGTSLYCQIRDHNPGPIGSGWDEEMVGFTRTVSAAADHKTNRDSKLRYAQIGKIQNLSLSREEEAILDNIDPYDREKLIKANVTFRDGRTMTSIFLIPHYLEFETDYEIGRITRSAIATIVFQ